ncbi:microtubule-associated tyrosine carboxypeptidase 1 isoform X1 [Poecile atricapillus]|uniref:microtubule-associated tyrosine carboxypeptidase 1 isoform X1 n=1 Tax=Poecile atricapillus TaxID=48891 RepID=UPI002739C8FD|nr:microtubule-associated tyrosine carboxypeptidase 1 isoform X1 [Poecile atricapillus]
MQGSVTVCTLVCLFYLGLLISAFKTMKALVCSFLSNGNFAGCVWRGEERKVSPALNTEILAELAPCTRPKLVETSASLIISPYRGTGQFHVCISLPAPVSLIPDFHHLCPVCSAVPFASLIHTNRHGLLEREETRVGVALAQSRSGWCVPARGQSWQAAWPGWWQPLQLPFVPSTTRQRQDPAFQHHRQRAPGTDMMLPEVSIWISVGSQLAAEKHLAPLVVVQLTDDLLSQAVMMVEDSRPTLAINLAGARQHWLEGMLRHEIGTHYIRGVNNTRQPWHSSEGRKQYSLKPANPTEEGLASLHSVLFRKQPFLWRAALLYYTIERASRLSFSALFQDLEQYVQDASVRWEYCVRAKRGQTDTSQPGCFSKDQVYLDGILRILRHRQTIDFPLLAALGKVSYEDVNRLKKFGVLEKARIPHFMQDLERYMKQLDHIVTTNGLNEEELEQLLPD